MSEFILALLSAALVNNLLLGLPLAADALRADSLQRFAPRVALLIALAAPCLWLLQHLLEFLALSHLALLTWASLCALLAYGVQWLLQRYPRFSSEQDDWPLLCANGLAISAFVPQSSFSAALAFAIGGALGLWLALTLLNDLSARLQLLKLPRALQGTPMLLICTGLISLVFMGFNGLGGA